LSEIFPENLKFFSVRIENFLDRIHDPQISKRIDAAGVTGDWGSRGLGVATEIYCSTDRWTERVRKNYICPATERSFTYKLFSFAY